MGNNPVSAVDPTGGFAYPGTWFNWMQQAFELEQEINGTPKIMLSWYPTGNMPGGGGGGGVWGTSAANDLGRQLDAMQNRSRATHEWLVQKAKADYEREKQKKEAEILLEQIKLKQQMQFANEVMAMLNGMGSGYGMSYPGPKWYEVLTSQFWYISTGTTFIALCSAKDVELITKVSTRTGQITGALNLLGTLTVLTADDGKFSWGDAARLGVAGITYVGTNYTSEVPVITVVSYFVTIADAAGAFDNYYKDWDSAQDMWEKTGVTILPVRLNNGVPLIIVKP